MAYLRIKSSLGSAEKYLLELDRLGRTHQIVNLWLPKHLKTVAFGGRAALMQLMGTWSSRHREHGHVRTYLDPNITRVDIGDELERADHILFAFFLGVSIFASDGKTDITTRIEPIAIQLIRRRSEEQAPSNQATSEKTHINNSVFVLISDEYEWIAPRWLYNGGVVSGGIVPDNEFTHTIAESIFDLRRRNRDKAVPGMRMSNLNWTVYELFKNTHQWARKEPIDHSTSEARIRDSVRAIYARYHSISPKSAADLVGKNQYFLDYITATASGARDVNLLEVSILDTGFGIANRRAFERYGLREFSREEQLKALRWALARERTESGHPRKGIGFHRAFLELTELGGFMQIRSGNLFAVRDFRTDPYPSVRERKSLIVDDLGHGWTEIRDGLGVEGDFSLLASTVRGTRITMFFPLDNDFFTRFPE